MCRLGPSACRRRCRCLPAVAGLLCLAPLSALPQAARPVRSQPALKHSRHLGDYVQIGEVVGWITKMGTLTTRVRTRKNEIITLPNSVVTSKEIINFSKPGDQGVVVSSKVGIGYDAPWRQVEGMLKLAARRTQRIRAIPEPFVLELSLNTFDITYEINAYLEQGRLLYVVLAELNRNILEAFNEFGVQTMTPAYMADPQVEKVVPRERWHQPPAPPSDLPEPDTGTSKAAD